MQRIQPIFSHVLLNPIWTKKMRPLFALCVCECECVCVWMCVGVFAHACAEARQGYGMSYSTIPYCYHFETEFSLNLELASLARLPGSHLLRSAGFCFQVLRLQIVAAMSNFYMGAWHPSSGLHDIWACIFALREIRQLDYPSQWKEQQRKMMQEFEETVLTNVSRNWNGGTKQ